MRPSRRAPDELRAVSLERGVVEICRRLLPGEIRRYPCAGHRLAGRAAAALAARARAAAGSPPNTACCRAPPMSAPAARSAAGKQSGRTLEIQRLIGRSLRAVVDLEALGERQITVDCDVLQADGGTRTAAITGAWVALHDCLAWMKARNMVKAKVLARPRRRDLLRHLQRHAGARSRLCRGFRGRDRRQFRHDRRRPASSRCRAPRRRRPFSRGRIPGADGAGAQGRRAARRSAEDGGGVSPSRHELT